MGTKEKLLSLFEENKGIYFSGEEIAEKLSVSRTAVWKAVNTLRGAGYSIDAVPNKGYCLSVNTDIISIQGIRKYLSPVCTDMELKVLPSVKSTNEALREKANEGAAEGYTLIANSQTGGKGRLGRQFYSPCDTGIYMSLLLRPRGLSTRQALSITTMAAVAVCEAMEHVSGRTAQIKWVNDIFMDGKKVSGILTEAFLDLESGNLDYILLGVGINAYLPEKGFPSELDKVAGAVFHEHKDDGKNCLIAEFLNRFMEYYAAKDKQDYSCKYRSRSLVLGKEINVHSPSGIKKATALDVDEDCHLLVRYEDGSEDCLMSGEITIRLQEEEGRNV